MKVSSAIIKEQEYYIQFELYRILKEYILTTQKDILRRKIIDLLDFKWERQFNIYPEVPVDSERIDLLITIDENPFLVIETKKRFKRESYSIAAKVAKTNSYAKKIRARYYAICNGWITLLFSLYDYPYLLGVYGVELSEVFAKGLLLGLVKYHHKKGKDILSLLPKVPDRFNVEKKIIPAIIQRYSSIDSRIDPATHMKVWVKNIHLDRA